jgi:hypothetical protein
MGKTLKKIIGVVAIVGLAIVTGGTSLVAKFALSAVLSFGVSKLLGNRAGSKAAGAESNGARIQLPPGTNNKLPVTYGTAFLGSATTDAKISTDQKTMWFVQAVTEVPDGATITFNQIYYDNKLVTFGTNGAVASLTNNAQGSPQVDTKVANKIFIYLFPNGSSSGINTGGLTANQILSDASIPVSQRWNGPIYTTGGQSPTMSNTAFMIIKLIYDEQAGVTGLGTLTAKVTCSITKPGAAILDYMRNERYGCAIPLAQIDTASLTALDTYSDGLINYMDVNGNPATQARYRINGPLDTGIDCLTNLQNLVDACDSWLQYSEITGKWKVVINKAYNQSPGAQTINDLYSVTSSNLVGGIDISPVDLNGTFNQLEVQYPDVNIKDQTNYAYIDLFTEYPTLISANEPINKLIVQNQLVNNFVQAKFIGIRRLLQSREDLVIDLQLDYSGIQLEAGDVIKVTLAEYGWTNKLFRVSAVIEEKFADGSLGAKIQAFEYNDTIYDNNLNITDFIPADNTGLTDPNIISKPPAPIVVPNVSGTLNFLDITGNVPNVGLVMSLDFNYGFDSNTANHLYYTTINNSNGAPLIPNSTYSINVNNIEQSGNIYWSTTARNRQAGNQSNASTVAVWPGANVSVYDPGSNTGGVTFLNTSPNAMGQIYNLGWTMASGPRAIKFEDGANRANYYAPFYLDGVSVSSSQTDPYGQGTATIANGYPANSLGTWDPYFNSPRNININDDGWVIVTYADWTGDNIVPGEALDNSISLGIATSNAPEPDNIRLQLCPFVVVPGFTPVGEITLSTNFQKDLILPGGNFYGNATFNFSDSYTYVINGNTTFTGYAIRNITNSKQVLVLQTDYKVQQRKL